MNNLVSVPKNGSLTNTNSNEKYPTLSNWLDDLFNKDVPSVFTTNFNSGISLPKVNIKETPDSFMLEMAVPGFKKSDFQLHIDNDVLSIHAEIKEESENNTANYTRKEFGYSSFKRTFNLPETINDEKIDAKYQNGILSIHLPKKEEAKQKPARNIKIS